MNRGFSILLAVSIALLGVSAGAVDGAWTAFEETGTIEITTQDEDGDARETPIWIVVLDEVGFVCTNDSRWLANIRRGSEVTIAAGEVVLIVRAEEDEDAEVYDRVQEAFNVKYGWMQRMASWFQSTRPTVLRLTLIPPAPAE
ncbi:MAG: DUF2255 family protein [bacterium]|nr:DUF2255 family protein [bacterium]